MRTRRVEKLVSSLKTQIKNLRSVNQKKLKRQGMKKGPFNIANLNLLVRNIRQALDSGSTDLTAVLKKVAKNLSDIQSHLHVSSDSYGYFEEQYSLIQDAFKGSLAQFQKQESQVEVKQQKEHQQIIESRQRKKEEKPLPHIVPPSSKRPQQDSSFYIELSSDSPFQRSYDLRDRTPARSNISGPKKTQKKPARTSPEDQTRNKSQ